MENLEKKSPSAGAPLVTIASLVICDNPRKINFHFQTSEKIIIFCFKRLISEISSGHGQPGRHGILFTSS